MKRRNPGLGRGACPELVEGVQADSIVPVASQGVQAWDRYAYVNNNPVRYNDPSGHAPVPGPYLYTDEILPESSSDNDDSSKSLNSLLEKQSQNDSQSDDTIGVVAFIFDIGAASTNLLYLEVLGVVTLVCVKCGVVMYSGYPVYSIIPNTLSTIATSLWISQGIITGETNYSSVNTTEGTVDTISVSQDSLVSFSTNTIGWNIKDPTVATALDVGVVIYDFSRFKFSPIYWEPVINPTVKYNTQNRILNFNWNR